MLEVTQKKICSYKKFHVWYNIIALIRWFVLANAKEILDMETGKLLVKNLLEKIAWVGGYLLCSFSCFFCLFVTLFVCLFVREFFSLLIYLFALRFWVFFMKIYCAICFKVQFVQLFVPCFVAVEFSVFKNCMCFYKKTQRIK